MHVYSYNRLPHAHVAARIARIERAPQPIGPTPRRSIRSRARRSVPVNRRPQHEPQIALLGSRKGLRKERIAHSNRHLSGPRQNT